MRLWEKALFQVFTAARLGSSVASIMNALTDLREFDPLLNAREEMFARWYGQLGDISAAYLTAFPKEDLSPSEAKARGQRMLRKAPVRRRAIEWRAAQAADMAADIKALAAFYRAGMTAERTLIQHHRVNCHYCWGEGGLYQWTLPAYLSALAEAEHYNRARSRAAPEKALPSPGGGFGYDCTREPNPTCGHCQGQGEGAVYVGDVRDMSPDEAIAFEGLSVGNNGAIKATYISKADAAAGLMKLRGIGADNVNLHLTSDQDREAVEVQAVVVPRDPHAAADFYRQFLLTGAKAPA